MSLGPEKASKHQQLLICMLTLNGDNCHHYYFYYSSTVFVAKFAKCEAIHKQNVTCFQPPLQAW